MGRNKLTIARLEAAQRKSTYSKRQKGLKKKGKELSILCDTPLFIILFNPFGKAELVLGPNTTFEDVVNRFVKASPKERYESKKEGIKALKKSFERQDHNIDVQQLMNQGGYGIFDEIMQGQDQKFGDLGKIEQLKILQIAFKTSIELIEKKKKEMSSLRERASANASASAFQQPTNQAAINHPRPLNGNLMNHLGPLNGNLMNHPGPLNGNLMNPGTTLLLPNNVPTVISCPTKDELIAKKKMEMSSLRERAIASASAFAVQHSTNQAAMNHPRPLNGNLMNQGTTLLQPNMNSGSNSDPLAGLIMALPPEDIFSSLDHIIHWDN